MNISTCARWALLVAALASAPAVLAKAPAFEPRLYGDGEVWGTKGTTTLPAPNEHNRQSFDKLFIITNPSDPESQLPVSEAAPGNPEYNGGRWFTHTVDWTDAGFEYYDDDVPVLTSYDEIMYQYQMGHVVITEGSFPDGPPRYFQCPLLPVK